MKLSAMVKVEEAFGEIPSIEEVGPAANESAQTKDAATEAARASFEAWQAYHRATHADSALLVQLPTGEIIDLSEVSFDALPPRLQMMLSTGVHTPGQLWDGLGARLFKRAEAAQEISSDTGNEGGGGGGLLAEDMSPEIDNLPRALNAEPAPVPSRAPRTGEDRIAQAEMEQQMAPQQTVTQTAPAALVSGLNSILHGTGNMLSTLGTKIANLSSTRVEQWRSARSDQAQREANEAMTTFERSLNLALSMPEVAQFNAKLNAAEGDPQAQNAIYRAFADSFASGDISPITRVRIASAMSHASKASDAVGGAMRKVASADGVEAMQAFGQGMIERFQRAGAMSGILQDAFDARLVESVSRIVERLTAMLQSLTDRFSTRWHAKEVPLVEELSSPGAR